MEATITVQERRRNRASGTIEFSDLESPIRFEVATKGSINRRIEGLVEYFAMMLAIPLSEDVGHTPGVRVKLATPNGPLKVNNWGAAHLRELRGAILESVYEARCHRGESKPYTASVHRDLKTPNILKMV